MSKSIWKLEQKINKNKFTNHKFEQNPQNPMNSL